MAPFTITEINMGLCASIPASEEEQKEDGEENYGQKKKKRNHHHHYRNRWSWSWTSKRRQKEREAIDALLDKVLSRFHHAVKKDPNKVREIIDYLNWADVREQFCAINYRLKLDLNQVTTEVHTTLDVVHVQMKIWSNKDSGFYTLTFWPCRTCPCISYGLATRA